MMSSQLDNVDMQDGEKGTAATSTSRSGSMDAPGTLQQGGSEGLLSVKRPGFVQSNRCCVETNKTITSKSSSNGGDLEWKVEEYADEWRKDDGIQKKMFLAKKNTVFPKIHLNFL